MSLTHSQHLTSESNYQKQNHLKPSSSSGSLSNGSSSSRLKKLRPWSLSSHIKRSHTSIPTENNNIIGNGNFEQHQNINGNNKNRNDENLNKYDNEIDQLYIKDLRIGNKSDQLPKTLNNTWEEESDLEDEDAEEEGRIDTYSWIDPSIIGTDRLRDTPDPSRVDLSISRSRSYPNSIPKSSNENSENTTPRNEVSDLLDHAGTAPSPPAQLLPDDSYAMLLAFQSTSTADSSQGHGHIGTPSIQSHTQAAPLSPLLATPSESGVLRNMNPEWYELVDRSLSDSLNKEELKRQGLWWEMIKGEREYVKDMKTVCEVFIQPLREHDPPLLSPPTRLHAFIAEVFSTTQQIYHAHVRLLGRLMERQRHEWPLMTTATDILLGTLLEIVELYESYMKNYPFAEARVRREVAKNPPFRTFLSERNTFDLTRRRDISVFLSRPVTRLPRILLVLEALYKVTPHDHPDKEDIPTAMEILQNVVRSTQPGIESAENKIKLWNTAERLLFKKGEVVELDIGDPKRTLVHMGYVFRRVRSETNWHGWQDLRAILLDNYFLLTRDEENGKHVVVSRRKPGGHMLEPVFQPERLMFPFTVSTTGGVNGRTYTLCTATQGLREEWREKIEGAKTLRKFDVEGNRIFAVHNISVPLEIKDPITSADTFTWHNRETIAIATSRSVWLGWRRDSKTFRELLRFNSGHITMISVVPDFGWILVVSSGSLLAYDLREMIPTSNPDTWITKGRLEGQRLSEPEHNIAFARVGVTKSRLLVVYAVHSRNSHQTNLYFYEPLVISSKSNSSPFRSFGSITVPGYASDLSFFRQTVSIVTEKTFVIAEPGNPTYNCIPTFGLDIPERGMIVRMVSSSKPLAMWQVDEAEFLLVYEWGGCWVTKFGEVSRKGSFLRWNLIPSYVIFKQPYLILFEESQGRAEIRDVISGRICELIEEKGLKVFGLIRFNQGIIAKTLKGLIEIVETVPL
uniref:DH domain-containing protein n=1 Tax=Kwoniella pini CBS 10737 TaxID=1296096 RepID=A0A1B9I9H7_9TREE|nr:uncharacterized protein I206_01495 [Kwoniella pini CBS 10737]OCF52209.1 hypothetical protein I206_01495 [Kwoniella pini CBS 10737]